MSDQFIVWGAKDLNTSAQLILAKRLRFFEQVGLKVQCKLFPSEQRLTGAFETSGERPFAWSQTVPELLHLRARGDAVKIIAPLADISASYQVVLREDAGIVLPGELEQHKIGIVSGSLSEIAFRNMAKDFGVDLTKINFVNAPPVKQLEMFVDGEVDGIACWEPWTSQAQYVGGKLYFSGLYSQIPGHEGKVNWLTGQSMLVTFEETVHSSPETLVTLLKGIKQATDYLNTTINKAAFVLSDLLGVENDELVVLLQKNMYSMKMDEFFHVGLASIRDLFVIMTLPDHPDNIRSDMGTLPITDLYVSHLLQQVDPSLIQITEGDEPAKRIEIIAEDTIYYPADSKIQSSETTSLRYIIVDDTKVVIDLFSEIVEMVNGTVVGTASTGSEALIQYIDLLPDVVVMDISMPDMSGIEAIKRISTINPTASIIVISGNNYEETRKEVFDLGVKLFIGKPFHVDQVVTVLSKLIG
jgi:two-component system chemotaxis response regulator CheY